MKLIIADKKFIKNMNIIILFGFSVLSGCQKVIYIHEPTFKAVKVTQRPKTTHQPAQFYVCRNDQYPCAEKISSRMTMKDLISIYSLKPKGVVNENYVTQKNTVCQ